MVKVKLQILPVILFMLLFSVEVNTCAGETEENYADQIENKISAVSTESDEDEINQNIGVQLSEQEEGDGDEIHFGWYKKDNDWYYYSPVTGQKLTGWRLVKGIWYYMDAYDQEKPGVMIANQKKMIGNADYFFAESGAMQTGWVRRPEGWYYAGSSGAMKTGWIQLGKTWYYLDGSNTEHSGLMLSNCGRIINNRTYFFNSSGAMQTGWVRRPEGWYYADSSGAVKTGWIQLGKTWYYLDKSNTEHPGLMLSNCGQVINNRTYFFNSSGAMQTGWVRRPEGWYYADSSGAMKTGWIQLGKIWYYMDSSGKMLTGWQKLNEKWYYLNLSGEMVSGRQIIDGIVYYFDNNSGALAEIKLDALIRNAVQPVGKTLYVWGGGWNTADNAAGEAALYNGVWPEWETYFQANKNGYSYRPGQTSWKKGNRQWRLKGLDCSGYLGWLVYNSVTGGQNKAGYVVSASRFASSLTNYSFGSVASCNVSSKFFPGDIVSLSSGHCYLVLGQCSDGSVLLLHSAPNGGVQVSGTVKNSGSSIASQLAQQFMQQNYPEWWSSFGSEGRQSVNADTYLNGIRFSWQLNGSVSDPSGIRNMTGEQVLNYLK